MSVCAAFCVCRRKRDRSARSAFQSVIYEFGLGTDRSLVSYLAKEAEYK